MTIVWICYGGYHTIGLCLGVISMHFMVFFKVKVQNGSIFRLLNIHFIFWGVGGYFGGGGVNGRCLARAYVGKK